MRARPLVVAGLAAFASLAGAGACSSEDTSGLGRTPGSSGASGSSGGGDVDGGTTGPGAEGGTTDGGTSSGDGGGSSTGPDGSKCKYQAHKTGLTPLQQTGGLSFHVYAPATYDPKVGHAVVVIMHGQDSNGVPELNSLWKPIADAEQLVLVAPKGSRPATNGNATAGNWATADLNKVADLVVEIDDCYNVFPKKRILWGFSAGTFYGYLLGIGAAELFSGLAMGGANTSFARQNGYEPKDAKWKIPVSHVHGVTDFNAIGITRQDKADFEAAGHVFTLREHPGGHSISPAQVRTQYDDLAASVAP